MTVLSFGLMANTEADLVVWCEDDAYVRRPAAINEAFEDIEANAFDLVGSPRHEDYGGQFQEWGPYTPGDGRRAASWPMADIPVSRAGPTSSQLTCGGSTTAGASGRPSRTGAS